MGHTRKRPHSKINAASPRPSVQRTLRDHMDVMDDVVTDVLAGKMDTRKANTLVSASRQWGTHLNTAIRATKAALPEKMRLLTGLPEAATT